jgi:hypothetical protein
VNPPMTTTVADLARMPNFCYAKIFSIGLDSRTPHFTPKSFGCTTSFAVAGTIFTTTVMDRSLR